MLHPSREGGSSLDQQVLALLVERMPRMPLAGQTLEQAERRRWRDPIKALAQRYVQYNLPHSWAMFLLDLDPQDAELTLADAGLAGLRLPLPNFQTRRRGGNQQAGWLLRTPVGRSAAHRLGPQLFASSVYRRLGHAFLADRHCTGRVMRGILHEDQATRFYHADLYDLRELSAALPAVPTLPREGGQIAGRNWQMFVALDRWAARRAVEGDDPQGPAFRAALAAEAQRLLALLPEGDHPYTRGELHRTIESVLKRTRTGRNTEYAYARASAVGLYVPKVRGAALRGHVWSHHRPAPLPPEVARANQLAALEIGNQGRQAVALAPVLAAARRLAERGVSVTTRAMQAELLAVGVKLSERKLKKHAPHWREEARRAAQEPQGSAAAAEVGEDTAPSTPALHGPAVPGKGH